MDRIRACRLRRGGFSGHNLNKIINRSFKFRDKKIKKLWITIVDIIFLWYNIDKLK